MGDKSCNAVLAGDPALIGIVDRRQLSVEAINVGVPAANIDVKTPNKSMANIPNRKIQIRAFNRKGLQTIELSWDSNKHLKSNRLLQLIL